VATTPASEPRPGLRARAAEVWFDTFHRRLSARGRLLFWAVISLAVIGLDTRITQVYLLFGGAVGLFAAAFGCALLPPPRARATLHLPDRCTAGAPVTVRILVGPAAPSDAGPVRISWQAPPALAGLIAVAPDVVDVVLEAGAPAEARASLTALRRGRYELPWPDIRRPDPLGLAFTKKAPHGERALLVHPRFFAMDDLVVPAGRRYQPGGIPLSSSAGESLEFMGVREYRAGDPLRAIHWRSFARRGAPVVMEFQEEYFCRTALVLDTFADRAGGAPARASFEAALTVLASIADRFSRSDAVVDILAAGPDVYEVSAGRSLAPLDHVLDVLACIEPSPAAPFAEIGPSLMERLARLTAVFAVLLDWDPARAEFLGRIRALGTPVHVFLVRAAPPTLSVEEARRAYDAFTVLTPDDVEGRLEAPPSGGRT